VRSLWPWDEDFLKVSDTHSHPRHRNEATVAATHIQTLWRGIAAGRYTREKRVVDLAASIKLQAAWRGLLARRYAATKTEREEAAALQIGAVARGMLARNKVWGEKRRKTAASTAIGSMWRMVVTRRAVAASKATLVGAVIQFQALGRGFLSRKSIATQQESWYVLRDTIMVHMPHNQGLAAQTLVKLPVSSAKRLEILNRLPLTEDRVADLRRAMPAGSIDDSLYAQAPPEAAGGFAMLRERRARLERAACTQQPTPSSLTGVPGHRHRQSELPAEEPQREKPRRGLQGQGRQCEWTHTRAAAQPLPRPAPLAVGHEPSSMAVSAIQMRISALQHRIGDPLGRDSLEYSLEQGSFLDRHRAHTKTESHQDGITRSSNDIRSQLGSIARGRSMGA